MSALILNGQLLSATEEQLRELIALTGRMEDPDGFVAEWLVEWAKGDQHYIADSPWAPVSTEGPASAERVIRFLIALLHEH